NDGTKQDETENLIESSDHLEITEAREEHYENFEALDPNIKEALIFIHNEILRGIPKESIAFGSFALAILKGKQRINDLDFYIPDQFFNKLRENSRSSDCQVTTDQVNEKQGPCHHLELSLENGISIEFFASIEKGNGSIQASNEKMPLELHKFKKDDLEFYITSEEMIKSLYIVNLLDEFDINLDKISKEEKPKAMMRIFKLMHKLDIKSIDELITETENCFDFYKQCGPHHENLEAILNKKYDLIDYLSHIQSFIQEDLVKSNVKILNLEHTYTQYFLDAIECEKIFAVKIDALKNIDSSEELFELMEEISDLEEFQEINKLAQLLKKIDSDELKILLTDSYLKLIDLITALDIAINKIQKSDPYNEDIENLKERLIHLHNKIGKLDLSSKFDKFDPDDLSLVA
ncbi:MAG: hypothetical protein ACOC1P_03730, partial [Minisyncoccales bacterium]